MLSVIIILTCIKATICIKAIPGVPVPGAHVLEAIFTKHIKPEGSALNFLRRSMPNDTEGTMYADFNLDINVLDVQNVRRMINLAKKKFMAEFRRTDYLLMPPSTKSKNRFQTAGYKTHVRENPFVSRETQFLMNIEKVYQLMQQSIYATQYRIEDTKVYRARFVDDPSYKIALLYGACIHYINKLDSLYAQQRYFWMRSTHYLWYLIVYEKILQTSIDINYAIERLFLIHEKYLEVKKSMPVVARGVMVDKSKYEDMLHLLDPETLKNMGK